MSDMSQGTRKGCPYHIRGYATPFIVADDRRSYMVGAPLAGALGRVPWLAGTVGRVPLLAGALVGV